MRQYVYIILAVLIASIIIQPLAELGLLFRDQVAVSSAIANSSKTAEQECYTYFGMRDIKGEANEEVFKDVFGDNFSSALDLSQTADYGNTLKFTSNDGHYNDFTVTLDFSSASGGTATVVKIHAESDYKFKMGYLKAADAASGLQSVKLEKSRTYTMSVTN